MSESSDEQSSQVPHERLLAWRKRNQLTQAEAAKRFGLAQSAWSELETGKRAPNRDDAVLIELETGIPLEAWSGDQRVADAMNELARRRRGRQPRKAA